MTHTTDAAAGAIGVWCNVCWEIHDVHHIYVLPCGHGYCAHVLKNQTRKPPHPQLILCPHCKQQFKPSTRRRVFLDLRVAEDSAPLTVPPLDADYSGESLLGGYPERVYQQAASALEGIDKLDAESLAQSVRRAASEIKKVADRMDATSGGADKVQALLLSLSAFIARTATLWGTQTEVAALRQQLVQRRNRIADLEDRKAEAERVAEAAVTTAERLQKDCVKLREEKEGMQIRLDKAEEDARERMQSISRLQDSVNSYKKRDVKHLAKVKEMEEQLEERRKRIEALEEQSAAVAEEKLALESQLQMSQAAYPPDSEHDTSDGFDDAFLDIDLDDDGASFEPFSQASTSRSAPLRGVAHPAPPPQRPKFGSGWALKPPTSGAASKRKREPDGFPIARDSHGHALKAVALGPRMKLHRHN